MPPFSVRAQLFTIDQPRELSGELLTLVLGGCYANGKTAFKGTHYVPLDATEVIEIRNDTLAVVDGDWRHQRRTAYGDIHELAGIFLPVGSHETAEQSKAYALVASPIVAGFAGSCAR